VLIFYADEYGDHSMSTAPGISPSTLKPGVSEYFVLSAVGVRDSSRKPLAEELFALKRRHLGEAAKEKWGTTEIKGRYLFRASRSVANGKVLSDPPGYAVLDTVEKVDALVTDLGLVFAKYRPLTFMVAVDKVALLRHRPDTNPLGAAYAYIHQRVALSMERLYAGDAAIVVADQQTQHESYFRSGQMHRTREAFTSELPVKPNFNLVLDKPLWVDTDLSSWDREILQLADIVAYTAAECMKRGRAPTEACYLWERIKPCLQVHWSSGRLLGAGFSVHPSKATTPDI
jgi:acyl-CoA-binding protein